MEKCPACERKFKGIRDFPLIVIHEFRRLEVPETLEYSNNIHNERIEIATGFLWFKKRLLVDNPNIPINVLEDLRKRHDEYKEGDKIYRRYFERHTDGTPKRTDHIEVFQISPNRAYELMKSPEVLMTLSELEKMVGREVRMDEILALRGFGPDAISYGDVKDIEFLFSEKASSNALRKSVLGLAADIEDYDCHLGGSPIGISQDVAEITYEGRVNSH